MNLVHRKIYVFIFVIVFTMHSIKVPLVRAQQATSQPPPPFTSDTLVIAPGTNVILVQNSGASASRYLFLARQGEIISLNAQRTAGDGILVLELMSSDGIVLEESQSNDLAGITTQLQFPVTVDGWYWLDARLDPNSGGNSGTFALQLTGTTPYLMTLAPSRFPLTGTISAHMVDLFTLTSSPTATVTLTPSLTLTPSNTPTITQTPTDTPTSTLTPIPSATLTPLPTIPPSNTPTPVPLPTKVTVSSGIQAILPDSPEQVKSMPSVWATTNFHSMSSPGTQSYSTRLSADTKLWRFTFRWCAGNGASLADVTEPIAVNLFINDLALDSSVILVSDVGDCRQWATLLSGWKAGQTVVLRIHYELSRTIQFNSGTDDPGAYDHILTVKVI